MSEQPKKKWYKRWWAFILYFFIFIFIISSMSGGEEVNNNRSNTLSTQNETPAQPEPAIKVSAFEISEEYDANNVAAGAKYENKVIEISGVIDSIGRDILDDPYVTLKGREYSLFGVQCMFNKAYEANLIELSKGQNITLTGKVSGELIGNVIVRGCEIVR